MTLAPQFADNKVIVGVSGGEYGVRGHLDAYDPDTGKLRFYHQELPHDAWDFDSSVG